MNTLEKADKFLQYKFFNVNYLLEINYKVGNLIDLQDDLQDYIANNEPELHEEFMEILMILSCSVRSIIEIMMI